MEEIFINTQPDGPRAARFFSDNPKFILGSMPERRQDAGWIVSGLDTCIRRYLRIDCPSSQSTHNLSNHIPVCAAETPLRRYLCWFFLLAFAVPRTVPGVIAALLLIIKVKLCLRDTSPKICHTYLKSKQK